MSVSEALLFSNGERVARDFLGVSGDSLLHKLGSVSDTAQVVDLACWNILGRPATSDEQTLFQDYLERRGDRNAEACRQLVWTLLTSSENRFNH